VHARRSGERLDLDAAALKLAGVGEVVRTPYLVRCHLRGESGIEMTLFADGRLIVSGTTDRDTARSLYARYVGA
jgi:molybdopterin-synthase adenylyltransferase